MVYLTVSKVYDATMSGYGHLVDAVIGERVGPAVKEGELTAEWNYRFMRAIGCYLPEIARGLLGDCRGDVELFGFQYTQEKWKAFMENSLAGGVK